MERNEMLDSIEEKLGLEDRRVTAGRIFPEGCWIAWDADGELSPVAGMFIMQYRDCKELMEHPCYGCRIDDCEVREVNYHDEAERFRE